MHLVDLYEAVEKFHKNHNIPTDVPLNSSAALEIAALRSSLINEELSEMLLAIFQADETKFVDALGDLLYVVIGTAVTYGVKCIPEIMEEIQRSNMTKTPSGDVRVSNKGPDYVPPNLKQFARYLPR